MGVRFKERGESAPSYNSLPPPYPPYPLPPLNQTKFSPRGVAAHQLFSPGASLHTNYSPSKANFLRHVGKLLRHVGKLLPPQQPPARSSSLQLLTPQQPPHRSPSPQLLTPQQPPARSSCAAACLCYRRNSLRHARPVQLRAFVTAATASGPHAHLCNF